MRLRKYQKESIDSIRESLGTKRATMLMLPTGGGKTVVFSSITEMAANKNNRTWIVVPRNTLLKQASDHLRKHKISHGIINAKSNESLAYKVHIVSKDTLIRRYDKIRRWPDLLIFDEAHLYIDRQIEIASHLKKSSKIIGVTATPERLDGRGLSELYEDITYGSTIKELIDQGYLSNIRYFCPPIKGLEKVHRKGSDYNEEELHELLQKRQVYGSAIKHYKKYADGKPALVFCRSIKAAKETAQRFNDAGYKFENIDGQMNYKKQEMLIEALKKGEINGLTSCDLITYGLDVPRIECIIMLRPTLSRTIFFQMIGRGLRPWLGKQFCIVLDHVGNLQEHGHPLSDHIWQFYGTEKRKKKKDPNLAYQKLCDTCFMYYEGTKCPNCGSTKKIKRKKNIETIDGNLIEAGNPIALKDRPRNEIREFQEHISRQVAEFQREQDSTGKIAEGPIGELLKVALELGNNPMWVYWRLCKDDISVNVPLLSELARQTGYKTGWVWYKKKEISRKLEAKTTAI